MATLSLSGVHKAFGAVPVLQDIELEIHEGEFVVLVGPSGCGKSTLLRLIAGLEQLDEGVIKIGERIVTDLQPKDRDIAMVFQNYALYPHMTVADNMSFSLRLRRSDAKQTQERVAAAAEILGLNDLLDRHPRQLSGGQRQRVAMGRAIVRDPSVFLFDEPLSNLDAKLRTQMRTEIKALHQKLRTTIVYVTHDQVEAMTMADRIVVMRDGFIEQIGRPQDLYDAPINTFVAGFIGSPAMNFLHGRVEVENSSDATLVLPSGQRLSIGARAQGLSDEVSTIGLRPERLVVGSESASGALRAKVLLLEPTGSETVMTATIDEQSVTVVLREAHNLQVGDNISLSADPADVHLFGADGLRLGTGARPLAAE